MKSFILTMGLAFLSLNTYAAEWGGDDPIPKPLMRFVREYVADHGSNVPYHIAHNDVSAAVSSTEYPYTPEEITAALEREGVSGEDVTSGRYWQRRIGREEFLASEWGKMKTAQARRKKKKEKIKTPKEEPLKFYYGKKRRKKRD